MFKIGSNKLNSTITKKTSRDKPIEKENTIAYIANIVIKKDMYFLKYQKN